LILDEHWLFYFPENSEAHAQVTQQKLTGRERESDLELTTAVLGCLLSALDGDDEVDLSGLFVLA